MTTWHWLDLRHADSRPKAARIPKDELFAVWAKAC